MDPTRMQAKQILVVCIREWAKTFSLRIFSHKNRVFREKRKTLFDFSAMRRILLILAYDEVDFESTTSENDKFSIKKSLKITYDAFSLNFCFSFVEK